MNIIGNAFIKFKAACIPSELSAKDEQTAKKVFLAGFAMMLNEAVQIRNLPENEQVKRLTEIAAEIETFHFGENSGQSSAN